MTAAGGQRPRLRVGVFSARPHDRRHLGPAAAAAGFELVWFEAPLDAATVALVQDFEAVCVFVNDVLDAGVLEALAGRGVKLVALRCAGFNNVDVAAAARCGIAVARVPAYSPHAVAEHAVGLMLTLNRRFHRAHARVREGNFSLDGLMGFDMHGRVAGVVGTGRIGEAACRILLGFGCRVLASDPQPRPELAALGVTYVRPEALFEQSDIITLHCPLTPATHHLVSDAAFARMRDGVMLINTSRGALVDTRSAIAALKSGRLGSLGLDVYEEEGDLFFRDLSDQVLRDDVFARLLTFSNVVITAHQGFFTREAVTEIAATTVRNLLGIRSGGVPPENRVTPDLVQSR